MVDCSDLRTNDGSVVLPSTLLTSKHRSLFKDLGSVTVKKGIGSKRVILRPFGVRMDWGIEEGCSCRRVVLVRLDSNEVVVHERLVIRDLLGRRDGKVSSIVVLTGVEVTTDLEVGVTF